MNRVTDDRREAINFLLGVGCQKGGTSWLHSYLSRSSQVNLGFRKEYHVFDALYIDECRRFYDDIVDVLNGKSATELNRPNNRNIRKILSFYHDTQNYFRYFQNLSEVSHNTRVVGDITPSYAGLPPEAYQHIKENLLARGLQPKVIFFLRDPFERCWSAVRMGRRNRRALGQPLSISEERQLLNYHASEEAKLRTCYNVTVGHVAAVFPEADIHVEFYERLFTKTSMERICAFLGIDFIEPDFTDKVNASPKKAELSESTARKVTAFYRPVYEWAFAAYGEELVRSLWPSARYL